MGMMKFPTIDLSQSPVFKFKMFEDRDKSGRKRPEGSGRPPRPYKILNDTNPPMLIRDLKLKIREIELAQTNKIVVTGRGITKGITAVPNKFKFNLENMDFQNIRMDIEGPSYVRLTKKTFPNGNMKYEYTVGTPGEYIFQIMYRNHEIPGSPFVVQVTECKNPILRNNEAVVVYGKGLKVIKKGELSSFKIDLSKTGNKDGRLAVYVESEEHRIHSGSGIRYISTREGCKVEFICYKEGTYSTTIKYNGKHIPGSPFQVPCVDGPGPEPGFFSALKWFK